MKNKLIQTAIDSGALGFGDFKLKSGRSSPYFFNLGDFCTGSALNVIGEAMADHVLEQEIEFDVIFGPAYKGISLGALTAAALYSEYGIDAGFTYDRKEAKNHGEGGNLVGASLEDRQVLIIDDVITDGATKVEALNLVKANGGEPAAVIIALDRQEKADNMIVSATQAFQRTNNIDVSAVLSVDDIIRFMENKPEYAQNLEVLLQYQEDYGVAV